MRASPAGRADLLRALKAQHDDARIFAVGDDWQSIYRFAGPDPSLMRHFGEEFGGRFGSEVAVHSTVDLGRTFRSVDRIALPARAFVLQNPAQITKQVIPASESAIPALFVALCPTAQGDAVLHDVLTRLSEQAEQEADAPVSVLLLARYRFRKPKNMAQLSRSFPGLSIRFLSIRASKGLEADHVIILRAEEGRLGLPSEIVDDPVLDLVLPEPERFSHAEDRRVFYVALTRAELSVTVLASEERPSAFVVELCLRRPRINPQNP
jgi:DNA helicase IV